MCIAVTKDDPRGLVLLLSRFRERVIYPCARETRLDSFQFYRIGGPDWSRRGFLAASVGQVLHSS
jgi:hypothetical protein